MYLMPLDFAGLIKARDYDGIKALVISKMPLVIAALVILIVGFLIADLVGKLTVKTLKKKKADPSIHGFIKTIVVFILRIIFVLSAFSTLGVNINSFVAALAAGGVTAGLGLQSSVSQFASGLQILLNHPFRSGDFIDIGDVSGTVREIKLMYTVLITLDNRRVIVPNSHITSSNLINYTAENLRRTDLVFSISYEADIERAKQALRDVAAGSELIKESPEPVVAVCEHGESSIKLACQVWCAPSDYWKVFYYMQEAVKLEFDRCGVAIPYSQLDVHIIPEKE